MNSLEVAWMHFEQSAILTVHTHVITRNPRISVSHDKHRTWILHINNVQEEDKGRYMCQINTATAKTQFGYLHVVEEIGKPVKRLKIEPERRKKACQKKWEEDGDVEEEKKNYNREKVSVNFSPLFRAHDN
ncbi:hypothetical protein RUM43_003896 [Polyplax serrata]|uniref:Ig-like domain-containing protein n=1 Tax=Polyplax serrata TaxID=468196 RepID=A0AAN8PNR8_POLSC